MSHPRPLFRLFSVFSNKHYIFSANQCEKCPSSLQCQDLPVFIHRWPNITIMAPTWFYYFKSCRFKAGALLIVWKWHRFSHSKRFKNRLEGRILNSNFFKDPLHWFHLQWRWNDVSLILKKVLSEQWAHTSTGIKKRPLLFVVQLKRASCIAALALFERLGLLIGFNYLPPTGVLTGRKNSP